MTKVYAKYVELNPGDRFADCYTIVRELGHGAMGNVYLVEKDGDKKLYAVKMMLKNNSEESSESFYQHFLNEVRVAATMSHPSLISAYDAGIVDGQVYFYVMEYVDGMTLKSYLLSLEELPNIGQMLEYAIDACHALNYAWQRFGMTHGDIKPDNIILTSKNQVKLADFGLSQMMGRDDFKGETVLTPYYAAPELIRGERSANDCRTDIYAMGATLYHLIAGTPPYVAETSAGVMEKHQNEKLEPLCVRRGDVPKYISDCVGNMLEKDKTKRPRNWQSVLYSLQSCLERLRLGDGGPGSTSIALKNFDTKHVHKVAKHIQHRNMNKRGLGMLILLLVLLVLALIVTLFSIRADAAEVNPGQLKLDTTQKAASPFFEQQLLNYAETDAINQLRFSAILTKVGGEKTYWSSEACEEAIRKVKYWECLIAPSSNCYRNRDFICGRVLPSLEEFSTLAVAVPQERFLEHRLKSLQEDAPEITIQNVSWDKVRVRMFHGDMGFMETEWSWPELCDKGYMPQVMKVLLVADDASQAELQTYLAYCFWSKNLSSDMLEALEKIRVADDAQAWKLAFQTLSNASVSKSAEDDINEIIKLWRSGGTICTVPLLLRTERRLSQKIPNVAAIMQKLLGLWSENHPEYLGISFISRGQAAAAARRWEEAKGFYLWAMEAYPGNYPEFANLKKMLKEALHRSKEVKPVAVALEWQGPLTSRRVYLGELPCRSLPNSELWFKEWLAGQRTFIGTILQSDSSKGMLTDSGIWGIDDSEVLELLAEQGFLWGKDGGAAVYDWLSMRMEAEIATGESERALQILDTLFNLPIPALLPFYADMLMWRACFLERKGQHCLLDVQTYLQKAKCVASEQKKFLTFRDNGYVLSVDWDAMAAKTGKWSKLWYCRLTAEAQSPNESKE